MNSGAEELSDTCKEYYLLVANPHVFDASVKRRLKRTPRLCAACSNLRASTDTCRNNHFPSYSLHDSAGSNSGFQPRCSQTRPSSRLQQSLLYLAEQAEMLAQDSYNSASTSVKLMCIPDDTTGLERIMLAAQGDLQRLLSTFFARPIDVKCICANTSPRLFAASPENPITQSRQVHLVCANRVVCIATSFVTITSPESERLFLDEKYPIGQTFRQLCRNPQFCLLKVETLSVWGKRELRRTYTLQTEGIQAEILEVFPDRDMFIRGEDWLLEELNLEGSRASATECKPDWLAVHMGGVVHQIV